jgi:hypothetical protein
VQHLLVDIMISTLRRWIRDLVTAMLMMGTTKLLCIDFMIKLLLNMYLLTDFMKDAIVRWIRDLITAKKAIGMSILCVISIMVFDVCCQGDGALPPE